ncbi:MAG: enolase C-terminal domain-like protein [Planctomycetia bacterium]|nr:enolase C-terminal domain-like protein [Planctomycetia bacterium]
MTYSEDYSDPTTLSQNTMRLRIIRMDLPLRHVTIVSRTTICVVRAVVVELEQDGLRGYGEAYEEPAFGTKVEDIVRVLESCREPLDHYAMADPIAFGSLITPMLAGQYAAQTALEMAACDLWGKLRNRPLWRLWGWRTGTEPVSSYTITLDSVFRMLEKLGECPNWPLYRIKMGGLDDMRALREIRARTQSPFRLDVNGCWTREQAFDYLPELERMNIELIEQPFHPDDWDANALLREKTSIPIIADESCRCLDDMDKCVNFFDGINLKPIKFGGLYPTLIALEKAKYLGFKTLMGNTIESSIGASAVSQFAPELDYIYVDGPMQIDKRLGQGVTLDKGKIVYSAENGTGIRFHSRYASYTS